MSQDRKTILYINYVDDQKLCSGSSVRPAKILSAFEQEGHRIIVLKGSQANKKIRKQRIKEVISEIKKHKPDLCYIESPTYPIMLHADRKLIHTVHRMGIPIGYFYRDFYRKFPNDFPRRKDFLGKIKDFGLDILQYLTDLCLWNCDIVYLPSTQASYLFRYKDIRPLPPAGENRLPEKKSLNRTAIYVGGLQGTYDGCFLLDAFELLNQKEDLYRLILVCRKEEWENFHHPSKNAEWLEVHHASGKELEALYERASIALSAKTKTPYSDFAVSVKTFEYLGYGLPQIVNNEKAIGALIEKDGIGIVLDSTASEFADAIRELLSDADYYYELQNNVTHSLLEHNLWIHRVRQIVSDLSAG